MEIRRISESGFGVREITPDEIKSAIYAVEKAIDLMPDKIGFHTEHKFVHDIYARMVFCPKNSILTGKIHAHDDLLVIMSGVIAFKNENEERIFDASERPIMTVVKANTKPVIMIYEDSWVMNALSNFNRHETPEDIEKEVIIPNEPGEFVKELK
jgi:ABC-type microcin C transport system permease subunit YejE